MPGNDNWRSSEAGSALKEQSHLCRISADTMPCTTSDNSIVS